MNDRAIEFLFEQFRSRGDVAALGAVFDRTAPELFRVAQHLADDVHAAEDALQAAFLSAIEDAHTWDASRPLLPWLLGILANRVRELRRARRAPDPERVAARPHADPQADAHARELAAAVENTLADLPPPYREVLTRHLRDGRTPAEIASELGRAPGTVRVQLSRGLELVRRALPPSFALAGAALVSAGRGQAAVRATVLERALAYEPRVASPVTTVNAASVSSTAVRVALASAVLVAVCGLYVLTHSAEGDVGTLASAAQDHAPESTGASRVADRRAGTEDAADMDVASLRTPVVPAPLMSEAGATGTGIWIFGRVLGADEVDTRRLFVEASTPQLAPHEPVPVHADASFAIDVTRIVQEDEAPATCRVALTLVTQDLVAGRAEVLIGPEVTRQPRDAHSTLRCDLSAETTCGLRGTVAGIDTRKGATAVLYARTADGGLDPRFISSRSTEDSAFELRTRAEGRMRLLVTAPPLAPVALDVQLAPGRWTDVGTLTPVSGGVELTGRLQLPPGVSAAGATLLAERRYDSEPDAIFGQVALFRDRAELAAQFAKVAADGTFHIAGLALGAYDVELVTVPGLDGSFADLLATGVLAPAEELVLGSALQLVVVDVEHAHPSARVRTEWTFGPEPHTANAQVRGRGEFLVDASDDISIVAHSGDAHSDVVHVPARARALETVVRLELVTRTPPRGRLVLAPTSAADVPRRVRVALTPRAGDELEPVTLDVALEGDVYVANAVAPGEYSAVVEPLEDSTGLFFTSFTQFDALDLAITSEHTTRCVLPHATGGRIRVRCAGDAEPGSVSKFVLRDARGRAHTLRAVYRTSADEVFWDGANTLALPLDRECELFPNLPPGVYVLELEGGPRTATPVSVTVRASEITTAVLSLAPR